MVATNLMVGKAVLVAGATGYVGRQLVDVLIERGYHVRALVRSSGMLAAVRHPLCQEVQGNVLDPASLQAACIGCHAVISCVGTNMMSNAPQDREFSAIGEGMELLFTAARQAGARRLIILSSLNSESHRDEFEGWTIRERSLDKIRSCCLVEDSIALTVIAASMFFKDSKRIFKNVRNKGRVSSFGSGLQRRYNPIDGRDLAIRMADSLERDSERNMRIAVGGPDILTLRQIALLAADTIGGRHLRYQTLPLWALQIFIWFIAVLATFAPSVRRYKIFAEFLVVLSKHDAIGERCGTRHIADYFQCLHSQDN